MPRTLRNRGPFGAMLRVRKESGEWRGSDDWKGSGDGNVKELTRRKKVWWIYLSFNWRESAMKKVRRLRVKEILARRWNISIPNNSVTFTLLKWTCCTTRLYFLSGQWLSAKSNPRVLDTDGDKLASGKKRMQRYWSIVGVGIEASAMTNKNRLSVEKKR